MTKFPSKLRTYFYKSRRGLVLAKKEVFEFWNQNSGDWSWAAEKPRPIAAVNRSLWKTSVPSLSFYAMLGLSSVIATLGLLSGSAAVIIGAMIIAPLMGSILGIAYAIVVGNRRLLKRSALTTFKGILLSILAAVLITLLFGLTQSNAEILARVRPTLIDLGVAIAAGAAGAFAISRRQVENALSGVAISVALVPPLSVIGIGIAWWNPRVALGASVLFATNLTGIIFSGALIFLWQQYGSIERAKKGLVAGFLTLFILGIPLGWSLRNILIEERVHRQIVLILSRQTLTFADTEIRKVDVQPQLNGVYVELEVAAKANSISQYQVTLVRNLLTEQLGQPIQLKVRVVPIEIFEELSNTPTQATFASSISACPSDGIG
ncbi:TIGR00341 family protein [Acaryochloris sp. 'Moss Beach']|uniref:TIGR00341 family protein n=1 Tax=Acaryochloris sp. 'Moss Beach' TaxID=2740837 RepID=UPI001F2AE963|nr:TIGR00341 family protein [Acaryochloris sp. 'Moss Beach']UJB69026.1 TIGR00341 family protein [Acaryochloris sp. 'Moss Beach']